MIYHRHTFAVGVNNRLVLVDSRLPDVDGGERTVRRHSGAISDIAATEGSDLLFTSSLDGTVKVSAKGPSLFPFDLVHVFIWSSF
jgi:hypothetical protein